MSKYKVTYIRKDVEKVNTLDIGEVTYDKNYTVEIEIDEDSPDKVWIYLINPATRAVEEGGEFDKDLLTKHIIEFYNKYY
jgi:hypothetical protein